MKQRVAASQERMNSARDAAQEHFWQSTRRANTAASAAGRKSARMIKFIKFDQWTQLFLVENCFLDAASKNLGKMSSPTLYSL